MKKILCIGSVTVDIIVKPASTVPAPGTLRAVDSVSTLVGGCATNCANDLDKPGTPVSISCLVGNDIMGDFVKKEMTRYGVDTRHRLIFFAKNKYPPVKRGVFQFRA